MDIQQKAGYVLTQLRLDKRMTQAQFAKYLDIGVTKVSRWEAGIVTLSTIEKVCSKLDIKISEFFQKTEEADILQDNRCFRQSGKHAIM